MHSLTVVLLPPNTRDLQRAAEELLEPHLVAGGADRPARLDFWTAGRENIADEFTAQTVGVSAVANLRRNVCFVSRLAADLVPGAVVLPGGAWHTFFDHAWQFADGERNLNPSAWVQWTQVVKQLFATYPDHIAVEFSTHS